MHPTHEARRYEACDLLRASVDFTRNKRKNLGMKDTSTQDTSTHLSALIDTLTAAARRAGLNDTQWAAEAAIRKETLSRIRRRSSCDFNTLQALAQAVGKTIQAVPSKPAASTTDGHFPTRFDRAAEDRLLFLCTSGDLDPQHWQEYGSFFFMAGIAVMLASLRNMNRKRYLALAEALHPGSSRPEVFALWLLRSPLRPSRFVPSLRARLKLVTRREA